MMRHLSPEELTDRLRLSNPVVVDLVFKTAREQLASEDLRVANLERKAGVLLAAVGFSLTVVVSVGAGLLLGKDSPLAALAPWGPTVAGIVLAVSVLSAGLSAVFAWFALRIRDDFKTLSESDVFNREVLAAANKTSDEANAAASIYARHLAASYWRIFRKHFEINESKAGLVARGQLCFVVFVVSLTAIASLVVATVLTR